MAINPTRKQKYYWGLLATEVGCIICRTYHGNINTYVSIHHIDGRTKKGCHSNVIPLCFEHHQGKEGIHFLSRKVFEQKYGKQSELKAMCDKLLEKQL